MAVDPDHRRVAVIAVIVPGVLRRQHEVAGLHDEFLALHRGVAAVPLDDEAQSAEAVPVGLGRFARLYQLKRGVDRPGRPFLLEAGHAEAHGPASRAAIERAHLAGAQQQAANIRPAPEIGRGERARLAGKDSARELPMALEIERGELVIESAEGRVFRRVAGRHALDPS